MCVQDNNEKQNNVAEPVTDDKVENVIEDVSEAKVRSKGRSIGRTIALAISLFFCALSIVLIVYLTTQDSEESLSLSMGIYYWIAGFCILNQIDLSQSWWFTPVYIRRFAHCAEFFALGLTGSIFLNCLLRDRKKAGITAVCSCLVMSFMDEFLKTEVPGREFDVRDMGFDFIGYAVGILIGTLIG